ncbi:MAG: NAD-dependent epimerase/dehydratase family protein [Cyanobium sp.]
MNIPTPDRAARTGSALETTAIPNADSTFNANPEPNAKAEPDANPDAVPDQASGPTETSDTAETSSAAEVSSQSEANRRQASGAPVVAITGASGSLGMALLRRWHERGAVLIALSHRHQPLALHDQQGRLIPVQQVIWQVGAEAELAPLLAGVDVLILNHGFNAHGARDAEAVRTSLEINALSAWRLLELYAELARRRPVAAGRRPELWLNTSEAEIQPAVSPLYEISKRLIGQLFSLRALDLASALRLRRLVLGPFRSALNPIGLMPADWVATQILRQAWDWNLGLVIVTPNPLTYVLMPLTTLGRWLYYRLTSRAGTG